MRLYYGVMNVRPPCMFIVVVTATNTVGESSNHEKIM